MDRFSHASRKRITAELAIVALIYLLKINFIE